MQSVCRMVLIVEDSLSETVAKKILAETNKNYEIVNTLFWDKNKIQNKIKDINKSAKGHVFFVLTDQDTDDNCPPVEMEKLNEPIHHNLLYRFAVMEIESWVLAHRKAFSNFLSIPLNKIPSDTDAILKPKESLIELAKRSRSTRIRKDIVPQDNSTSRVGPDYNGRLGEFVIKHWDVNSACQSSASLKRTFAKLKSFTAKPIGSD